MSPCRLFLAVLASFGPALASTASAQGTQIPLREGDSAGFATVVSFAHKTIADDGSWVVHVDTDYVDPAADAALLDNHGQVRMREGDPLPFTTILGST